MGLHHDRFRDPGTWMLGVCRDDVAPLLAEWYELRAENEKLRELLAEFASCGIERDAGKYLVVQIDHESLAEAKMLLGRE